MKNNIALVGLEFKYLFRQRFLWILILIGIGLSILWMPKFKFDFDYDVFEKYHSSHSFDNMSEPEKLTIEFWQTREAETEEKRNAMVKRASEGKKDLPEEERFVGEYFSKIEEIYGRELALEIQSYDGWEIFFLNLTSMSPDNPISLLSVIIISAAGLLLISKDKENRTLFWASITGKGAEFSSFLLKIMAVFIYGLFVQIIFFGLYIVWLCFVNKMDMGHWFNLVQNIPQYRMCDLQLSILEVMIVDAVLKCILAITVFLCVAMFVRLLKKYIFLFLGGACVSGILYYVMSVMDGTKNYDLAWRMNLFSMFQLDRFLTYDALNIMNHAVDVRWIVGICWGILLCVLTIGSFKIWRKYLYAG